MKPTTLCNTEGLQEDFLYCKGNPEKMLLVFNLKYRTFIRFLDVVEIDN